MIIHGIDPGPTRSALVTLDDEGKVIVRHVEVENAAMLAAVRHLNVGVLVIEQVACYGRPVGNDVLETVFWSGRFFEAFNGPEAARLSYGAIALHFCGLRRAKESAVRQAVLDRFGLTRQDQIGTKAKPGPLYGVKGHEWSALAVALAYQDGLR